MAAVAGGLGFAPAVANAQDPAAPLWNRQCARNEEGREFCYVEQYAIAMPAKTVLLNVRFGFLGPQGQPRIILTVPLGTQLIPGLGLTIDKEKPLALPFESCQTGGCRTVADLDPASLDRFRRGQSMTVRFVGDDGKPLDIPVPLKGLDAAFKQLKP
ncbi:invasion associated locus B family protein [Azospirillum doebereinerae]|uniref:invasion associated locus B family protein n=1 Tax=Azospirillum doebereinerae TaxID=92933 RepID=UPI001EE5999D|nr:invasion associated locus B family protein [Azospirillum doebereinerae]MCG5244096.1 invasion associated locus B family protein [Azospirillum doebereinerae]